MPTLRYIDQSPWIQLLFQGIVLFIDFKIPNNRRLDNKNICQTFNS